MFLPKDYAALNCGQKASFSNRHWVITENHHYLRVLRISDRECLALGHLHQLPSPRLRKGRSARECCLAVTQLLHS